MTTGAYFISFEGIDRSGKSTQAAVLAQELGDRAMLVREPGGTILSERVRGILKDPEVPLSPRAEALLFAAARADLVASVIRPALNEGKIVIADRFVDSSTAYQGAVRGLGTEKIAELNRWASADLMPNLTLLVELDPAIAIERGAEENDRFENEGAEFQRKVASAYDEIATAAPDRVVRIDGDRGPDDIALDVRQIVFERLGLTLA
ncbi:MAG: dTMP kinase [Solirubrobacterales bacterium]